jgi:hypothetical protein
MTGGAARARLLAGAAVVVAGGLAAAAGYALQQATDDAPVLASASPSPTASPTPSATASPTPSPTPTPKPTPSPTPSPKPTPSPTPRATASPTPVRYPYPRPTKAYAGLHFFRATVDDANPQQDQVVTLTARALDGDGTIYVVGVDWGDDTVNGGEADPTRCRSFPSPSSSPPPFRPQPDDVRFTRTHSYSQAGIYTVKVTVRSVNADCRPNGPRTETATVTFSGDKSIVVTAP